MNATQTTTEFDVRDALLLQQAFINISAEFKLPFFDLGQQRPILCRINCERAIQGYLCGLKNIQKYDVEGWVPVLIRQPTQNCSIYSVNVISCSC